MKTLRPRGRDAALCAEANALARDFHRLMGGRARKGHRFDLADEPQERLCWQLAILAFDRLRSIDIEYISGWETD
jgi:hypothetical protein